MVKKEESIAYCGVDCAICDIYIATQNDDNTIRQRLIEQWHKDFKIDLSLEDINCNGCKTGKSYFFYCQHCRINKCITKKELENCAYCEQYACKKLQKEFNRGLADPQGKKNLDKIYEELKKI